MIASRPVNVSKCGHHVQELQRRGGVKYIVPSHPHFYSSMVDWALALDATILIHEVERCCLTGCAGVRALLRSACCPPLGADGWMCAPQCDRQWVMRPDDRIQYWKGDKHQLFSGVTTLRCSRPQVVTGPAGLSPIAVASA